MDKPADNNQTPASQTTAVPVPPPPALRPVPQAMAAPLTNSALPNKNAPVPKYSQCMASDPTVSANVLKWIESQEAEQE